MGGSDTNLGAAAMLRSLRPPTGRRMPFDHALATDQLSAAVDRLLTAQETTAPRFDESTVFFGAYAIAPALLLYWSGSHHRPLAGFGFYALALVLSIVPAGAVYVGMSAVGSMVRKKVRDPLWAFIEWQEAAGHDGSPAPWRRWRLWGIRAVVAVVVLALFAGGLMLVHQDVGWVSELVLIALLAPISAGLLAAASGFVATVTRPRRSRSVVPGDATMVDLLNLAFFCSRQADAWMLESTRLRILHECEQVAAEAECEFRAPHGLSLRHDPATVGWARDQSAQLAASLREVKRLLLVANRREHYDEFLDALTHALAAVIAGRWSAVMAEAPRPAARRVRRAVAFVLPSLLLAAAAFVIPQLPGLDNDQAAAQGLRATLLVTAVLTLLGAVSPDTRDAARVIRSATEKFTSSRS